MEGGWEGGGHESGSGVQEGWGMNIIKIFCIYDILKE